MNSNRGIDWYVFFSWLASITFCLLVWMTAVALVLLVFAHDALPSVWS